MFRYIAVLLCVGLILGGCKNDAEEVEDLDMQLAQLLDELAPGSLDKSYYKLPSSTDFSSIPQDPRNDLTSEKVELGKLLYHETALATGAKFISGQGTYSCSSCHHAAAGFQAGLVQGISDGGIGFGIAGEDRRPNPEYSLDSLDVQPIRTPASLNAAYQEVQLWNGQFGATGPNEGTEDSWVMGTPKYTNHLGYSGVETQAIAGLTVHRMSVDSIVDHAEYKVLFASAFPDVPESERITLETAGLAIAAYERTLLAVSAPFQEWLRGDFNAMTDEEKEGALLFFGKAGCASCHTGPALNSMEFYALGMDDLDAQGTYGDEPDEATRQGRGGFTGRAEDMFKFKVPQLYSLDQVKFFGHGGNFNSIKEIIEYKNMAVKQNTDVPDGQLADQFVPLGLSDEEVNQIVTFIEGALNDQQLDRYVPESVPSGNCFPNNDSESRQDLGCE